NPSTFDFRPNVTVTEAALFRLSSASAGLPLVSTTPRLHSGSPLPDPPPGPDGSGAAPPARAGAEAVAFECAWPPRPTAMPVPGGSRAGACGTLPRPGGD